jgi:alkylation response protein AidB-like acyl-CoA dehydrogenase
MGETPTLEEFAVEVESFLAERYPRRNKTAAQRFVWGQGSDEVRVFQEPDPDEEADALPALRAWRKALWDNGLGWVSGPVEYGGRGLPAAYSRTFERLAQGFVVPGDAALTVSLGMIAPTIARHGSEGQKQRYLPKMHSGELIACQLFSEPDAGSDLASVTTTARRDGDRWRLSGQKVWTSGAHLADFGEIVTRTAADPRHHNLTAFLVDMHAPGVEVRPLRQMTGGASFNEVFLDDVVVSDDDRLGEVDQGWPVALTTLSHERNAMGHSAFGGVGILSTEGAVSHGVALVGQGCQRHRPALVDLAKAVVVAYHHVVEEHLIERRAAGHLTQRSDLDPGGVHVDQEGGEVVVPGAGRGPGDDLAEVGQVGARRPHFLATQSPPITVSAGRGRHRGQI